jgi:hypothetical protein
MALLLATITYVALSTWYGAVIKGYPQNYKVAIPATIITLALWAKYGFTTAPSKRD